LDNDDDVLKQTLGFAETMNTDLIRDVALTPENERVQKNSTIVILVDEGDKEGLP